MPAASMNASRTSSLRPASGALATTVFTLLCELGLGAETIAEAMERTEQCVDLEQRVLAQLCRLEGELEVDRVRAVGDLEHELRIAVAASARGCVLDEDADERIAV